MSHLIIYAGPGGIAPSTRARYEQALGDINYEWLTVKGPAGGTSFEREVEANRDSDGRLLPHYIKLAKNPVQSVTVIAFSAGYGFARALFKSEGDREAVDAFLAVDAIHASIPKARGKAAVAYRKAAKLRADHDDPRSYVDMKQLAGFVAFCARAAKEEAFACLISSEITPHYASTRETSTAITLELDIEENSGDFSVYHQRGNDKAAHIEACNVTGPQMASERLVPWLMSKHPSRPVFEALEPSQAEQTGVEAWRDPELTLAQRCVAWSFNEMNMGVAEQSANWSPRIAEYFRGVTRIVNGRETVLGIDRGNWCAVGATFAEEESLLPGEVRITTRRVSGVEMQRDAVAAGTWRPLQLWLAKLWTPQVGDIVIWNRGKKKGPTAWQRHVSRVTEVGAGFRLVTIDANRGNKWSQQLASALQEGKPGPGQTFKKAAVPHPDLLGFIECTPRDDREVLDIFDLTSDGRLGPGLDVNLATSTEQMLEIIDKQIATFVKKGMRSG